MSLSAQPYVQSCRELALHPSTPEPDAETDPDETQYRKCSSNGGQGEVPAIQAARCVIRSEQRQRIVAGQRSLLRNGQTRELLGPVHLELPFPGGSLRPRPPDRCRPVEQRFPLAELRIVADIDDLSY